jgi:2-oxoisovalerate dehydrogenase E2 component (dihydrolipoyl transacylase)
LYRNVKASAPIQAFDPLLEVQSDKASVEITSPFDGIVKELLVKEGDIAKVGERLCLIEVEEEEEDTTATTAAELLPQKEVPPQAPKTDASPAPPQKEEKRKHPLDPSSATRAPSDDSHVLATPSVRHFARQKGVTDLSPLVPGSGRDGRLERQDIEAYLAGTGTILRPPCAFGTPGTPGADQVVELGRTRYAMWKSMTKSLEMSVQGLVSLFLTNTMVFLARISVIRPSWTLLLSLLCFPT